MRSLCFLTALSFLSSAFPSLSASTESRPNIIFLMTDDQRWDQFGCYGKPEFRTQHIDRLADQGVIFDNAFQAVAICMPSRVTAMTGRPMSSHRVGFVAPNDYTLSASDFAKGYPAILKEAGYRTGFIGKVGFSVTEEAQRPSSPKNYKYQDHFEETFDFFAGIETHDNNGIEMWPKNDPGLKAIYREGRKGTGRTLKTGEAMLRFLETQPRDQPFCLSVSFYAVKHDNDSHVFRPHLDLFKDQKFEVPDNWVEGANENLPEVVKKNARGVPLHLQRSSTPAMYQRLVRRFAAQGYSVDQQVGLMVEKLKEKGLLENTIIIYTSDNGRFQGAHGLFDKCILYEEAVKAPLIVFDGRLPDSKRGRREAALISSADLAPTILSLAGLEPPAIMQGSNFSGILDQTQDMSQWQDSVFLENLFLVSMFKARNKENADEINAKEIAANKSYRSRGVRTARWKYFNYFEHQPPIEELYDLENDPLEQNNLIDNPEYAEIRQKLLKQTEESYQKAIR